ncbi:hypothetical protein ACFL2O_08050 [Thermodesulfobacteriota bacterium]
MKLGWAKERYSKLGDELIKDHRVSYLLNSLKIAVAESRSIMIESGLSTLCEQCEVEEGGSCCGRGLEDRYSAGLLLINLMLNASLPEERYDESSCFFLGKKGCLLKARHAICVSYICRKTKHLLDPDLLKLLQDNEGIELDSVFRLNERIKILLRGLV